MTLPFLRLGAGFGAPAGVRLGRLRKAFGLANIDPSLGVPHLTIERTLTRKPGGPRRKLQPLRFPLPLPAKVAVLAPGFENGRGVRSFGAHDATWMGWKPDALVAPLPTALLLADEARCGMIRMPALSTALVVLSSLADGPLENHQRDRLWRAFQVPVFEQLCSPDGLVLARECEVHHGLHVDPAAACFEKQGGELVAQIMGTANEGQNAFRFAGDILTGCCECGAETPRLIHLAPLRIAATAAAGR